MGTVSGSGQYLANSSVTIVASPFEGYRFVSWSDGSIEATRQLTLISDTILTASFELIPVQGIDEVRTLTARIYPNPTTGILNVEADGLRKVEVIDAVGRVVISQNSQNDASVNMSALNNGIYSVRLTTTDGILVKKVAKR